MPVKTRHQKKPVSHLETTWGPAPPDSPPSTLRYPRDSSLPLASPPNPPVPLRIRQLQATRTPQPVGTPVLLRSVGSVQQQEPHATRALHAGQGRTCRAANSCVSPQTPLNGRATWTVSPCVGSNKGRAVSPVRSRFSSLAPEAKAKPQEMGEELPHKRRVTRQTPQQPQARPRLLLSPGRRAPPRSVFYGLNSPILEQPNTPQNMAPTSAYQAPARRTRAA